MKHLLSLVLALSSATLPTASAQLEISKPGKTVITFDETIPDVVAHSDLPDALFYALAEPGSPLLRDGKINALVSTAFTARQGYWNPAAILPEDYNVPTGKNTRTVFGDDYNGNGSTTDCGGYNLSVVRGSDYAPLGKDKADNFGLLLGNQSPGAKPFAESEVTLRVKNTSSTPLANWEVSVDVWFGDEDKMGSVLSLSFSRDGETFEEVSVLESIQTTNDQPYDKMNPQHWSDKETLTGSFKSAVPKDGLLYIRLLSVNHKASSGEASSGATFLLDNLAITAGR